MISSFTDNWDRENGPLGNGWVSSHLENPSWWDPLELRNNSPVNTQPDQGPIVRPGNSGGRASAYRDFGTKFSDQFRLGIRWNGNHQAPAFPIACINADHTDWGLAFCYEPEIEHGVYVLWALGRRPDNIHIVKYAKGPDHSDGQSVLFEMEIDGTLVSCLVDGKRVLSTGIPEKLIGSHVHGFGLDVNPVPGRIADVEVIDGSFAISSTADS